MATKDKIKQILMDAAKQVLEEYGVALHNVNFKVLDITDAESEGVLINSVEYNTSSAQQWQPIETAPKDGSSIMMLVSGSPSPYCVGSWDSDDEKWWPNTYHLRTEYEQIRIDWDFEPTHWMPLQDQPVN